MRERGRVRVQSRACLVEVSSKGRLVRGELGCERRWMLAAKELARGEEDDVFNPRSSGPSDPSRQGQLELSFAH